MGLMTSCQQTFRIGIAKAGINNTGKCESYFGSQKKGGQYVNQPRFHYNYTITQRRDSFPAKISIAGVREQSSRCQCHEKKWSLPLLPYCSRLAHNSSNKKKKGLNVGGGILVDFSACTLRPETASRNGSFPFKKNSPYFFSTIRR